MSGHVQVSLTPRPKVSAMTATRVHIERLAEPLLVWCNAYRHHGASRRRRFYRLYWGKAGPDRHVARVGLPPLRARA